MIKIKIKLEDFLIGLLSGMALMFISVIIIFSSSSYIISVKSDFDFYIEEEKVADVIKHNDEIYISAEEASAILDYSIDIKEAEGKMYLDKEQASAEEKVTSAPDAPGKTEAAEEPEEKEDQPEIKLTEEEISEALWEAKKRRSVNLVQAINKSIEKKRKLQEKDKDQLTVEKAFDILIKRTGDDPSALFYIEDAESGSENKYYNFVYSADDTKEDSIDVYYSVHKLTGSIDIKTSINTDSASMIPYKQWQEGRDN